MSLGGTRFLSLCKYVYHSRTNRQKFLLDVCGRNNKINKESVKKLKAALFKHIGKTYTNTQIENLKDKVLSKFNKDEKTDRIVNFVDKFFNETKIKSSMVTALEVSPKDKIIASDSDRVYQSLPDAQHYLSGPSFVDLKLLNKTALKAGKLTKFTDKTFGTEVQEYFDPQSGWKQ